VNRCLADALGLAGHLRFRVVAALDRGRIAVCGAGHITCHAPRLGDVDVRAWRGSVGPSVSG
jgi:hypothetical protein